jgi:hypothetical protein
VTLGLLGGTATVTELTPLLGGTAAVCFGLSATGVGVVVGIAVAVAVSAVVAYWLFTHSGGDSLAPAVRTTGTTPPYYIALSDGAVVRDDGTVAFFVRDQPEMMPLAGTDWVTATRKSAINRAGELSILTPKNPEGSIWFRERSDRRYIAVYQMGSWVAAISIDNDGRTYLEIPTGTGQPSSDSHIRGDMAVLNAGKNPHHHHMFKDVTIDPPVTGWKAFVPGDDYGLALADDGRVFCVGTTKDNLGDLHGRYTKVTTGVHHGRFENDRYAIGIRMDDGGLDFAGDDPNHINDDIKKAQLDHIIDVAAGPDRALALTSHGQIVVLGEEHGWDPSNPLPPPTTYRSYSAVSASVLPSNKCIFVLGEEPGQHVHITGKLVPGQPLPLAPESRVSRDLATLLPGSTMTYFTGGTRIESATGKSLWATDTETDRLHLPGTSGPIPATHVVEAPCSSIILDESTPDTTRVLDATTHELLITLHNHSDRDQHRHTASQTTAAPARTRGTAPIIQDLKMSPSWVVWAANHYTSTDATEFGSYEAEWTVPEKPKVVDTRLDEHSKHTQSCCFSSVQTYTQDGKSGGIFQPVLAYNWAQKFGQPKGQEDYNPRWSAWIYDYNPDTKKVKSDRTPDDHVISPTRITDLQSGDKIRAVITYDGKDWTASLTHTRPGISPQTVSLTRQRTVLDPKNVDTEVVYEAYLKQQFINRTTMIMQTHDDKYFMGNLKFDPIIMKDRNGKVILNEFRAYANKPWWDHRSECPNIGVGIASIPNPLTGGSLYYVVDLKTVG